MVGQWFKDRYDIISKSVTGKSSAVYVGGVNAGCELTPSERVKTASLTAVCEWVPSAWVTLSCKLVMRSFVKCGISLKDDVLWYSSGDDGNAECTTSEDGY